MHKSEVKTVCIISVFFLVLFTGCVENNNIEDEKLSAELNIFNWEDYFGPNNTTINGFETEYGVEVNLYIFDDEEIMLTELENNPTKYDIIVTSDSIIIDLIKKKSLAQINKDNIPNIENLNPEYLNLSFDPYNKYSIPYFWGTTGMAYNTSIVEDNLTSWKGLFDSNYSGEIVMLNNMYEVMGAALKYLGYSINTENITQLREAESLLKEQKNMIQGYEAPYNIMNKLIDGEVTIAHIYVGESYIAADENANITYIIPKEGAPIWLDSFAVPINSANRYTAEVFINYILDPDVSAEIINHQWTANPNIAAYDQVDDEILNDPNIYPSQEIINKCEYFIPLQGFVVNEYNRIWSIINT